MYCNTIHKRKYWMLLIVIGVISLAFGVVMQQGLTEDEHDLSMLMGMFTGMGAAFTVVGTIRLIRLKMVSPEKLKQEEIERNDERNVQILRLAYTVACVTSTILFTVLAFVFVCLGYRTPALITIGALYVQVLAFFLANIYYRKKM